MPKATIEIAGPLTLLISGLRLPTQANLDSAYSFCLRNPRDCEPLLTRYVMKVATTFEQTDQPPTEENLRAIVRSTSYVERSA
jgi:hypothetical protein